MIQDQSKIDKLIEEHKYHQKHPAGRPNGTTKSKMNIKLDIKLGRPIKTECNLFDPNKKAFIRNNNNKLKGEHINRLIRYEIKHNNTQYLFSTLKQVQKEFNISNNVLGRLVLAHNNMNNNKELSHSDKRILESYPKFQSLIKLPLDKSKRIVGIVRYDCKLNITDLTNTKLKARCS